MFLIAFTECSAEISIEIICEMFVARYEASKSIDHILNDDFSLFPCNIMIACCCSIFESETHSITHKHISWNQFFFHTIRINIDFALHFMRCKQNDKNRIAICYMISFQRNPNIEIQSVKIKKKWQPNVLMKSLKSYFKD